MNKKWEVTYKLPSTGSKRHTRIVEASSQYYAKQIAQAEIPSAEILGGAKPIR